MSSLTALLHHLPPGVQAFLGLACLVLQIVAAVHAVRTGRPFSWLWLIFVFPGLGALIYLFAEVLPHRGPARVVSPLPWLLDRLIPGRELARLTEALERSPTVANRVALAEYQERRRDYEAAIALYEAALSGVYRDDAGLLVEKARLHVLAGQLREAKALLQRALEASPNHEPQKRDFWLARVAEESGQREQAYQIYERMRTSGPIDEEARVRLALLLEDRGEVKRARELYTEVVRRMRGANNTYRRQQKPWLVMARQRLKQKQNERPRESNLSA